MLAEISVLTGFSPPVAGLWVSQLCHQAKIQHIGVTIAHSPFPMSTWSANVSNPPCKVPQVEQTSNQYLTESNTCLAMFGYKKMANGPVGLILVAYTTVFEPTQTNQNLPKSASKSRSAQTPPPLGPCWWHAHREASRCHCHALPTRKRSERRVATRRLGAATGPPVAVPIDNQWQMVHPKPGT